MSRVAGAATSSMPRSLMEGLPPRSEFLTQQKRNLIQFVADNKAAFDAMPYVPWTHNPSSMQRGISGLKFKTAPATPPLTGLVGVFSEQTIEASYSNKQRKLLHYPGLLVTLQLYERFSKQYFCPTGLELDSLEYSNSQGALVKMLVIGDPTSLGALINDGTVGRHDGEQDTETVNVRRDCCCCERALTLAMLCLFACQLSSIASYNPQQKVKLTVRAFG